MLEFAMETIQDWRFHFRRCLTMNSTSVIAIGIFRLSFQLGWVSVICGFQGTDPFYLNGQIYMYRVVCGGNVCSL